MSPPQLSTQSSYFTPARPAPSQPSSPLFASPTQKKTMSITQTYYLAHKARAKLSSEASRADHNLRLLVGHANLLDSLMLDLADAEREQESWFNKSVRGATKTQQEEQSQQRHIQWADTIIEEPEEDSSSDSDSYSDSDSDSSEDEYDDEGDVEMADAVPLRRVASHSGDFVYHKQAPASPALDTMDFEEPEEVDEEYEDDEEDYAQLTLTRSPSHSQSPPPELDEDEDSSEDETMPPSPPNKPLPQFTDKEREAMVTTGYYDSSAAEDRSSFYEQGFYLPRRNPARLVSAISVY